MTDRTSDTSMTSQEMLVAQAMSFFGDRPEQERTRLQREVRHLMTEVGEDALGRLLTRVQTTGSEWGYHPPDALSRRIHHALAHFSLTDDSELSGTQHLDDVRSHALVFMPNHLSYADANLFVMLLHKHGFDDVAERLTVIAGPKVYAEPFRRFSSLCFGTIKTPQSTSRSSGEAVMGTREVARLAKETIVAAAERQKAGDNLLVFGEGTRSRTARMSPLLAGTSRYFDHPGSYIVPVGIAGSEKLQPVGRETVDATRVSIRIGRALLASELKRCCEGNRRLEVDVVGVKVATELPARYRGHYGSEASELDEARTVAATL